MLRLGACREGAPTLPSLLILYHFCRPFPVSSGLEILRAAWRIFNPLNLPIKLTGQANICVTLGCLGTTYLKIEQRGALHTDIDNKRKLQTCMPRIISEL